jgi:4-oxalocrotonate tautomerase
MCRDPARAPGLLNGRKQAMPHVIVKMYPGRSEQTKAKVAEDLTKALMAAVDCAEASVSVSIEDVTREDWAEKVYKPDILAKPERVYKKPGYNPL